MRALQGIAIGVLGGLALWALAAALSVVMWALVQGLLSPVQAQCGTPWHPPTTHEHGDAPPAWVTGSAWQPFTQCAESHPGYKGFLSHMDNNTDAYLIAHILSTAGARSHGDHQYQLWIKAPDGSVSYWAGMLCFTNGVCTNQPVLTSDGPKPFPSGSIQQDTSKDCETWMHASYPGSPKVFSLHWYICEQNTDFVGVFHGLGHKRAMNFAVFPNRFPGQDAVYVSPTLAAYAPCGPKGCWWDDPDGVGVLRTYYGPNLTVPN